MANNKKGMVHQVAIGFPGFKRTFPGFKRAMRGFLGGLVFSSASCANAEDIPGQEALLPGVLLSEKSDQVMRDWTTDGLHGVVAVLVDRDKVLWAGSSGWADRQAKRSLTPDTPLAMASVSKVFTAIAVMQLVEAGQLALDKPVSDYLPDFRMKRHDDSDHPITIRHLLSHQSGMPSEYLYQAVGEGQNLPDLSFQALPGYLSDEYLVMPPGQGFNYSNTGFSLLGLLVEKASGLPFEQYMQQFVLSPVGMTHSTFSLSSDQAKTMAKGVHKGKEMDFSAIRDVPAGGLIATANDMAHFTRMLLNRGALLGQNQGSIDNSQAPNVQAPNVQAPNVQVPSVQASRLLSDQVMEEMFRHQNADAGLAGPVKTGLGVFIDEAEGRLSRFTTISHGGSLIGFNSMMLLIPETGLGVVVISNDSAGGEWVQVIAEQLLELAHEERAGGATGEEGQALADDQRLRDQRAQSETVKRLTEWPALWLEHLPGEYVTALDPENPLWTIRREEDHLKVQIGDDDLHLVRWSDGSVGLEYRLFGFRISVPELEFIRLIPEQVNQQWYFFDKGNGIFMSPVKPVSINDLWIARQGVYRASASLNPGITPLPTARIRWDKKYLTVNGLPMAPLNDQQARLMGRGRYLGETLFFPEHDRIIASGITYEKVR